MENIDGLKKESTNESEPDLGVEPENASTEARSSEDLFIDRPDQNLESKNSVETSSACNRIKGNNNIRAEPPQFIWAIGRMMVRFPDECIRREFDLAGKRLGIDTSGLNESQIQYEVLKRPENRYLLRKVCWVMRIAGMDTYIAVPQDIQDFGLLIDTITPSSIGDLIDVVVGIRGPIADPSMCNCLPLPIVFFDRVFSTSLTDLSKRILDDIIEKAKMARPKMKENEEGALRNAVDEVFRRFLDRSDNAGATDEQRALNYALFVPEVYYLIGQRYADNYSLVSVATRPSSISGIRKIVEVIFTFKQRDAPYLVEQFYIRVDTTCEFPFLVSTPRQYISSFIV